MRVEAVEDDRVEADEGEGAATGVGRRRSEVAAGVDEGDRVGFGAVLKGEERLRTAAEASAAAATTRVITAAADD